MKDGKRKPNHQQRKHVKSENHFNMETLFIIRYHRTNIVDFARFSIVMEGEIK